MHIHKTCKTGILCYTDAPFPANSPVAEMDGWMDGWMDDDDEDDDDDDDSVGDEQILCG